MISLGVIAYRGLIGAEANYTEALLYFTKAALRNNLASTFQLGYMLFKGIGTETDCRSAVTLLRPSAENGPWASVLRWGLEVSRRRA